MERELHRILYHSVEVLSKYGLEVVPGEVLWEAPVESFHRPIHSYQFDLDQAIEIGHVVADDETAPDDDRLAATASFLLLDEILPALYEGEPTWKLFSWSLLLTALIPDPNATTDKYLRLESEMRRYEPDRELGEAHRRGSKEGGRRKRETYQEQINEWQSIADDLWQKDHSLSKSHVARLVVKVAAGNPKFNTVRQKIVRPKKVDR